MRYGQPLFDDVFESQGIVNTLTRFTLYGPSYGRRRFCFPQLRVLSLRHDCADFNKKIAAQNLAELHVESPSFNDNHLSVIGDKFKDLVCLHLTTGRPSPPQDDIVSFKIFLSLPAANI